MRTVQRIAVPILALPLTASGFPAQGSHIGPGGVDVGPGNHHRRVAREYEHDDGCAIRVIRYRRDDGDMATWRHGDMVTRRVRHCRFGELTFAERSRFLF